MNNTGILEKNLKENIRLISTFYHEEKDSLRDTAKRFNVSKTAIRDFMKRHSIPRRSNVEGKRLAGYQGKLGKRIEVDFSDYTAFSSLLGIRFSDGTVKEGFHLSTIDLPFAEKCYSLLKDMGLNPNIILIYDERHTVPYSFRCYAYSMTLADALLHPLNFYKETIFYTEKTMKNYVQSYHEGDGCSCLTSEGSWHVSIDGTHRDRLILIKNILNYFDLRFHLYPLSGIGYYHNLVSTNYETNLRFMELLDPCIKNFIPLNKGVTE